MRLLSLIFGEACHLEGICKFLHKTSRHPGGICKFLQISIGSSFAFFFSKLRWILPARLRLAFRMTSWDGGVFSSRMTSPEFASWGGLVVLISLIAAFPAEAHVKKTEKSSPRHASLVVDYPSGNILHQENADKPRHPASLTKMMTIYLTFEAINAGRLSFDQELPVSAHAAKTAYSSFVKVGQRIAVRDLVMAAIVKSANDATVVLGEKLAGNEFEFAKMMTHKARQLNMHNTVFKNAHGLHHFEQKTTAIDMAKLAAALHRDFPEYYHLFSKTSFVYNGKTYHGHNRVLNNYPGATGLKTGFINASGFNIVTTAKRNDATLIAVVMGGDSSHARDQKTMRLLNKHFTGDEMVNEVLKYSVPEVKKSPAKSPRTLKKKRSLKRRN